MGSSWWTCTYWSFYWWFWSCHCGPEWSWPCSLWVLCSNLHSWHSTVVWWIFWQTCWLWNFLVTANNASRSFFSHGRYKCSMPSPSGASLAQGNPFSSHPHNSSSVSPLNCQYCDRRGHIAKTCYKLHGYPFNHSRCQATWLLDSGASHVTRDLANLTLVHDYTGNDKLMVVNGKGLTITHSGSISLPTSSSPLHLNKVLYVLNTSQNLLPISQLCQKNFVSIEFFPWQF